MADLISFCYNVTKMHLRLSLRNLVSWIWFISKDMLSIFETLGNIKGIKYEVLPLWTHRFVHIWTDIEARCFIWDSSLIFLRFKRYLCWFEPWLIDVVLNDNYLQNLWRRGVFSSVLFTFFHFSTVEMFRMALILKWTPLAAVWICSWKKWEEKTYSC